MDRILLFLILFLNISAFQVFAQCDDINYDVYGVSNISCDNHEATYCFTVDDFNPDNYSFLVDGVPYNGVVGGCSNSASYAYSYFSINFSFGPFEIVSWSVDDEIFTGTFSDPQSLVDLMNQLDPNGNWMLNAPSFIISGGVTGSSYSTIEVMSAVGTSASLAVNQSGTTDGIRVVLPYVHTLDLTINYIPLNCTDVITITNDTSFSLIDYVVNNESCDGADGSVEFNFLGSLDGLQIDWSDGVDAGTADSPIVENLPAGTYEFYMYKSDCVAFFETITIGSAIDFTLESQNADCGMSNGAAAIVSAETIPVIEWNNGVSGAINEGLAAGQYSVTIVDGIGCQSVLNVVIEEASCDVFISGFVYGDDLEGCYDNNWPLANMQMQLVGETETQLKFTNTLGYYEFVTVPGDYTIVVPEIGDVICPEVGINEIQLTIGEAGTIAENNTFYIADNTAGASLAATIAGELPRPGFDVTEVLHMSTAVGNVFAFFDVFLHFDPRKEFVESTISNYMINGNVMSWNDDGLEMPRVYFNDFFIPVDVEVGTILKDTIIIEYYGTEVSRFISCKEVVNSYDPNNKTVAPLGLTDQGFISQEEELFTYLINFQNLGTADAINVRIEDIVQDVFDLSTFRVMGSSHAYQTSLEGNKFIFDFENINLAPASESEEGSKGYIQFSLETNDVLPIGTVVNNTADIYFDFNEAIVTNTTVNTVVEDPSVGTTMPLNFETSKVQINPNPTEDYFYIKTKEIVQGDFLLELYDIQGRVQARQQVYGALNSVKFNVNYLSKGVYFLKIKSDNLNENRKIVIE